MVCTVRRRRDEHAEIRKLRGVGGGLDRGRKADACITLNVKYGTYVASALLSVTAIWDALPL